MGTRCINMITDLELLEADSRQDHAFVRPPVEGVQLLA